MKGLEAILDLKEVLTVTGDFIEPKILLQHLATFKNSTSFYAIYIYIYIYVYTVLLNMQTGIYVLLSHCAFFMKKN